MSILQASKARRVVIIGSLLLFIALILPAHFLYRSNWIQPKPETAPKLTDSTPESSPTSLKHESSPTSFKHESSPTSFKHEPLPPSLRYESLPTSVGHESSPTSDTPHPSQNATDQHESSPTPEPPPVPAHPVYKNATDRPLAQRPFVPVKETFPLAAAAKSAADLPPIPAWNIPPAQHVPEKTPIFVGFTRNWPLLQQAVVSLITAGWPPEDIYVVENTGVMDSNRKGRLTLQNPFYLDHDRLTRILGVKVLVTPSYQTFAQLQNYYLAYALDNDWPQYFWAHMDIVVQSGEAYEPYKSFYLRAVDLLREAVAAETKHAGKKQGRWALRYYAYDWVTLMNTAAMVELGGWDSMIGYYTTDCDMYERMHMANMTTDIADAGPVYDVGESYDDLIVLYRRISETPNATSWEGDGREVGKGKPATSELERLSPIGISDTLNSSKYHQMQFDLKARGKIKNNGDLGPRNRWQVTQMGGKGEPFYRDMDGFAEALEIQVQAGIQAYTAKWHARSCGLKGDGLKLDDAWLVARIEGKE